MDFCTIISKNYLAQARVLAKSLKEHHPQSSVFVLLIDRIDDFFDPTLQPFTLFLLEELPIPDVSSFCFQYDILELNTAAKPFFMEFLLKKFKMQKLVYLDPDIKAYSPMIQLNSLLDKVSFALTPHILTPYDTPGITNTTSLLLAGIYNLGFIGVSNKDPNYEMLKWWQRKLYKHCIIDLPHGIFVDQKWMNLAPLFFPDCEILLEQTYNVAYWNLHERKLSFKKGTLCINEKPCVFFHFSGFNPLDPNQISKYQNKFTMEDLEEGLFAFQDYAISLFQEGYEVCSKWPYTFAHFNNGSAISREVRNLYRTLDRQKVSFQDPFDLDETTLKSLSF